MSKIKILPDSVANKIAAGEVIERPASVVKELVENALDAGAGSVKIAVEGAGCKLIAVSDDGEGMDPDDAMLCLEPHATSKIFTDEDINGIRSFGFRGEAMPSIASVSRMTVRTRRRESLEGVEVFIAGGKLISSKPVGCAPGTETSARDLFFNTPARKKFLKTASTEERHIIETVSLLALSHPHASFELTLDGAQAISTHACGEDLRPRLSAIFGRALAEAMVPVSWTACGIQVSGFIARRGCTRPSRNEQKTFVNGRPVEALPIYRGIKEGCGPMLERGRHQPCAIFLSLDPYLVDVNVHPAKREVRFRREFDVVNAVRDAVASALKAASASLSGLDVESIADKSPSLGLGVEFQERPAPEAPIENAEISTKDVAEAETASLSPELVRIMTAAKVDYAPLAGIKTAASLLQERQGSLLPPPQPAPQRPESPARDFRLAAENASVSTPASLQGSLGSTGLSILGVIDDTYIVASMPGGLAIIDQHAAHERILFERLLKGVNGSLSQRLLIPASLELGRADIAFIEKNSEQFGKLGFELEPFGQGAVKLNAIPAALSQDNAGGMLKEILSKLSDDGWSASSTSLEAIAMASCKAAVKAHDKLSKEEALALLKQMAQCEQPFACPHGRPTVVNISVKELERRFGRK